MHAPTGPHTKILTKDELAQRRADAKREGRSVVQCHGCFDIVHPGHIRHLRFAAKQGDLLLVTITGDAGVGKGDGRPLFPQELRAENLAALDCVDWVYVNPEPTASGLLAETCPDVYIKGREYETNADPRFQEERRIVEESGGRVVYSSGDVVFSSTALVSAMEDREHPAHAGFRRLVETHNLTPERLEPMMDRFAGLRVLVLGETIIDTYVHCDRPDVAGESPVMSLRPVEQRSYDGGAAIIARHLAAMGARPVLLTALPPGHESDALRQRLAVEGVLTRTVTIDPGPLLEKQRYLVGPQKVMKVDLVRRLALDAAMQDEFIHTAAECADACDAAIIADFCNGLLSPALLARVVEAIRPRVRVLSGDVSGRRSSLLGMRSMDLLCPTEAELRNALHDYEDGLNAVVWRFMERVRAGSLLVTLGAEGLIAFDRLPDAPPAGGWATRLRAEHVPATTVNAIDPLGCGDALVAAATLAMTAGGSVNDAAFLGSIAAGVEAQRVGNLTVSARDLRHGLARLAGSRLTVSTLGSGVRLVV